VRAADAVEHIRQHPAQLAIVPIVESLEIDLVEIHVRPDKLEHLGRDVAVADESADDPPGAGGLENRHRPIRGDERLVVGADHHRRASAGGNIDQFLG
jgi:hypothetical protein